MTNQILRPSNSITPEKMMKDLQGVCNKCSAQCGMTIADDGTITMNDEIAEFNLPPAIGKMTRGYVMTKNMDWVIGEEQWTMDEYQEKIYADLQRADMNGAEYPFWHDQEEEDEDNRGWSEDQSGYVYAES